MILIWAIILSETCSVIWTYVKERKVDLQILDINKDITIRTHLLYFQLQRLAFFFFSGVGGLIINYLS